MSRLFSLNKFKSPRVIHTGPWHSPDLRGKDNGCNNESLVNESSGFLCISGFSCCAVFCFRKIKYQEKEKDEGKDLIYGMITQRRVYKRNQRVIKSGFKLNYQQIEVNIKKQCAIANREVQELNRESWDRYVSNTEYDVHGAQTMAYKIMSYLNKTEKDTA